MSGRTTIAEREFVRMDECTSTAHFVEQVARWLKVASPRARYYVRLHHNEPEALVLGDGEIVPNSAKYQYVSAQSWLNPPS